MRNLDTQIARYKDQLRQEVGLTDEQARKVATLIEKEIRFLPLTEAKEKIQADSPVLISKRWEELVAYQGFEQLVSSPQSRPEIVRAHVIVQIYICLVYLMDSCFQVIKRSDIKDDSVVARCANYLSTGRRRKLRNAFSHANWQYKTDFSGLECWIKEDGRLEHFVVSQQDLDFWCTLSRGVAYPIYQLLHEEVSL